MNLAVCYLSRKKDSENLLWRFIESYRRHETGYPHDLIIIFKGYGEHDLSQINERLKKIVIFEQLVLQDVGFDIGSYSEAAKRLKHHKILFLNSHSQILCKFWIEKFVNPISRGNVVLVGASGSYQSRYSSAFWSAPREKITLKFLQTAVRTLKAYSRFPNAHIRTNAFLIERQAFLGVTKKFKFESKEDCYYFESGRQGLTQTLRNQGFSVLVVGRDGIGYDIQSWERSKTFFSGSQENLLISDNQTTHYRDCSEDDRKYLNVVSYFELRNAFGLPMKARNISFRVASFLFELFLEIFEIIYLRIKLKEIKQ